MHGKRAGLVLGAVLLGVSNSPAAPGGLDTTFGAGDDDGTDGVAELPAENQGAQSTALAPDGKVYVTGDFGLDNGDLALAVGRYRTDGTLDTSFGAGDGDGVDGLATWTGSGGNSQGASLTIQPDGKVLVAGMYQGTAGRDLVLARFAADGSLDSSFGKDDGDGTDGVVTWDSGSGDDQANAVALQPDGKVLVAGYAANGTYADLAVARFTAEGALDTTFGAGDGDGTDGVALWGSGNGGDWGFSVALQPDGKVLVTGYANNGTDRDLALARFTADGALDTTFGAGDGDGIDGVALWDSGNGPDRGYSLALQPDGRVLVAGFASNGSDKDLAVARFAVDGSLDTAFGNSGVATWDRGNGDDRGEALALQPDGGILVAGEANNGSHGELALARFTAGGTLDTTFGTDDGDGVDGVATWDSGSTYGEKVHALTLQADGQVVAAGTIVLNGTGDGFLARFAGGTWGSSPWDAEPDAVSFSDKTGVEQDSRVESGKVALSGLGSGVMIPVRADTGGLTVLDDQGQEVHSGVSFARAGSGYQIKVAHTSGSEAGKDVTSRVTAGGVSPTPRSRLQHGASQTADFTSTTNQAPSFTGGTGSIEVADDTAQGKVITTLAASDPEGQDLTFAITSGNGDGHFALDGATGELTVASSLDYETDPNSYDLGVKVSDPVGGEAKATVTVSVTDAGGSGGGGGGGCAIDPGGRFGPLLALMVVFAALALRRRSGMKG